MGWFSSNNKHYREAAELKARAVEKQSGKIQDAVDEAQRIEAEAYSKNEKALMPAFRVTTKAIKDLRSRAERGDFTLPDLMLEDFNKIGSFEDYLKERGYTDEPGGGYSAFDYVQNFKKRTRETGRIDDPSYDFMARQMERSVRRSQAASGMRLGGAGMRELSDHMGDFANTKYAEAHQRAMAEGQLREGSVLNRYGLQRQGEMDNNNVINMNNQNTVTEWEAQRQGIQQEIAVLREQLNLGGVRDMVGLTETHSQNRQQTLLTGATAQANLGIAAADARAQGIIDEGEADAANKRSLGQLAGTLVGAGIGAVAGGPWGAAIGANIGSAATGGGSNVPVPSRRAQTPAKPMGAQSPVPSSWRRLRSV